MNLQNYQKTLFQEYFNLFSQSERLKFGLYCKYQLLRYKPWKTTQNNAWGDQEPTNEILTNHWQEFLQTPYGQINVPDWFDKLQTIIQIEIIEIESNRTRK